MHVWFEQLHVYIYEEHCCHHTFSSIKMVPVSKNYKYEAWSGGIWSMPGACLVVPGGIWDMSGGVFIPFLPLSHTIKQTYKEDIC